MCDRFGIRVGVFGNTGVLVVDPDEPAVVYEDESDIAEDEVELVDSVVEVDVEVEAPLRVPTILHLKRSYRTQIRELRADNVNEVVGFIEQRTVMDGS